MSVPASRKRKCLLCRFNLHHKWERGFNPDGEDYLHCKACGEDLYGVERHERDMTNFGGGLPRM